MFRAYILLGFTILIARLHISGNITKYINMKYAYLSTTAAIILGFLTIIQIIVVFQKSTKRKRKMIAVATIAIAGMIVQKMRIHGGKKHFRTHCFVFQLSQGYFSQLRR